MLISFSEFCEDFNTNIEQSKGVVVQGIHYSHHPHLESLSGDKFGTGIKGAEHERLSQAKDKRIKDRIYFYNKTKEENPHPESGLGPHVYHTELHKIYDGSKANDTEKANINLYKSIHSENEHNSSNAFESAVIDSGYHGYTNGHMTVVLNHPKVDVKYQGHRFDKKVA